MYILVNAIVKVKAIAPVFQSAKLFAKFDPIKNLMFMKKPGVLKAERCITSCGSCWLEAPRLSFVAPPINLCHLPAQKGERAIGAGQQGFISQHPFRLVDSRAASYEHSFLFSSSASVFFGMCVHSMCS